MGRAAVRSPISSTRTARGAATAGQDRSMTPIGPGPVAGDEKVARQGGDLGRARLPGTRARPRREKCRLGPRPAQWAVGNPSPAAWEREKVGWMTTRGGAEHAHMLTNPSTAQHRQLIQQHPAARHSHHQKRSQQQRVSLEAGGGRQDGGLRARGICSPSSPSHLAPPVLLVSC